MTADGWLSGASVSPPWHRFADEMAANPPLVQRLLMLHHPNPSGQLCVTCTTPGCGTPQAPWPCALFVMAQHAERKNRTDKS